MSRVLGNSVPRLQKNDSESIPKRSGSKRKSPEETIENVSDTEDSENNQTKSKKAKPSASTAFWQKIIEYESICVYNVVIEPSIDKNIRVMLHLDGDKSVILKDIYEVAGVQNHRVSAKNRGCEKRYFCLNGRKVLAVGLADAKSMIENSTTARNIYAIVGVLRHALKTSSLKQKTFRVGECGDVYDATGNIISPAPELPQLKQTISDVSDEKLQWLKSKAASLNEILWASAPGEERTRLILSMASLIAAIRTS